MLLKILYIVSSHQLYHACPLCSHRRHVITHVQSVA
uniref:Uncharacterized protein n=1 Tax=Arundo donax TaxID=35708 RepID=A0A0A9BVK5_ARUDO